MCERGRSSEWSLRSIDPSGQEIGRKREWTKIDQRNGFEKRIQIDVRLIREHHPIIIGQF